MATLRPVYGRPDGHPATITGEFSGGCGAAMSRVARGAAGGDPRLARPGADACHNFQPHFWSRSQVVLYRAHPSPGGGTMAVCERRPPQRAGQFTD
ncbi:hypothetical protein FJT64_000573 [Amphibalanus amphitrite]|uniref:Uncharacterized protein n=1 Tax=Amphibalanus amphitrite TaxID=1232801 RepID=A0A6A4VRU2_AMPAM|nr:hypothetical protein FJT64_000573 [Amphibalanus amphitrite]